MISNVLIRDQQLSLRAKGLYVLIESYITIPDFVLYKWYLQKQCTEGQRAFDSAWKELKDAGYLVQYKMRDGSRTFYYEYELLDEPGIITKNDGEKESNSVKSLDPHFVGVQNEDVQNVGVQSVDLQNVGGNNNIELNNTITNNTRANHIISIPAVRDQIGYDAFSNNQKPLVDNFVLLISDVMGLDDWAELKVNGTKVSAANVKERFKMLDMGHIEYALTCLESCPDYIRNPRQYFLTVLYNAPVTADVFLHNLVENNLKNSCKTS